MKQSAGLLVMLLALARARRRVKHRTRYNGNDTRRDGAVYSMADAMIRSWRRQQKMDWL